jgi:N utilization substance protein B
VTAHTWVESTEVSARSKARKRALDLLFEAEQRGVNAETLLTERIAKPATQHSLNEYTVEIVRGVVAKWNEINELLSTYSQGWTIERMPAVDRAILRIGAWEVVYSEAVPDAVAMSEAVALATLLSTDDSPTFVNGLLARLAEVKATLV